MAYSTEVEWGDGTGDKLYFSAPSSEGNQTVTVSSDENAGSSDRTKTVNFQASGVTPQPLQIIQLRGGSGATVKTTSASGSDGLTQTFTGLDGEPVAFSIQCGALDAAAGTYLSANTNRCITSIICNGTTLFSASVYRSGSTAREYLYQTCTYTYNNGTLTVTSPGTGTVGAFLSGTYKLIYVY